MNCDCNEKCFYFKKLLSVNDEIHIYNCYRCGKHTLDCSTKKKKCGYKNDVLVSKKEHNKIKIEEQDDSVVVYNLNEKYKNDLNNYIKLYIMSKTIGIKVENYIAHINFIINKLGYNPWIEQKESVYDLLKRLRNYPDKKKKSHIEKKTVILDISDILKNINKPKIFKKRKTKKNKVVKEEDRYYNSSQEDSDESDDSDDSDDSDESNDSDENENNDENEDNYFDVDNVDSDDENYDDNCGEFSD